MEREDSVWQWYIGWAGRGKSTDDYNFSFEVFKNVEEEKVSPAGPRSGTRGSDTLTQVSYAEVFYYILSQVSCKHFKARERKEL